ncbi:MAG: arylesterase [Lautropia sp.]
MPAASPHLPAVPQPPLAARRRLLQWPVIAALWPHLAFAADANQVLILGDSLSAGYGLDRGEGWVSLLERRTSPLGWEVVNASISGETTAGGLSRLPALLRKHRPAVTVIELGANDALRGLSLAVTEANLRRLVSQAKEAGSKPLLIGMMLPPNFGAAYTEQFRQLFGRIAESESIPLVPFLLAGFADDMDWFQSDRIHPTAKAQARMLDNVWPVLSKML